MNNDYLLDTAVLAYAIGGEHRYRAAFAFDQIPGLTRVDPFDALSWTNVADLRTRRVWHTCGSSLRLDHDKEGSVTLADSVPAPVFVGGTGRSGTTIVGDVLGHATPYALVPVEIRCHTAVAGLADLALGKTSFDDFQEAVREKWFYRPPNKRGPRGLHVIISREALDEAVERLRAAHERDPWQAAGDFLREMLGQFATQAGKQTWVEMTPPTARRMSELARMLPEAKFIHMVRDGRDVASSVLLQPWGPKNFPAALNWWSEELIQIEEARAEVAPDRVLTMRLESLVGPSRDDAYARLSDFLSLGDDTSMRTFFDANVTAGDAHSDRWSTSLEPELVTEYQELYENHLQRLKDAGAALPEPR